MIAKMLNILQQECRLMADSSILIGVSGGPDSLCLLDLLIKTGYPLIVATFDHLLRPQSGLEVEFVRQFCADRRIVFVTGQADVRQHAREQGLSIEESARQLRYDFLFHQAQLSSANAVAVGHTADDQVETILMHLLRGTGLSGLVGMRFRTLPNPWSATIPLIRPLLSTWHNEIDQYVEQHELPVSYDQSNLDQRFFRNRLRHELIPQLETYNPNVRKALWRTALVLADEQVVLEHVAEAAWQVCIDRQLPDAVRIQVAQYNQQPVAVQRALLRKAIGKLRPGLRDIDFEAIERAREFIQSPSRSRTVDLIAGLRLYYELAQVWLARQDAELSNPDWPQLAASTRGLLDIPGKFLISPTWELQASFRKLDPDTYQQALNNRDPYQAWLDPERLALPLVIRTRSAGDRFQPLGFGDGSMKLSDFLINAKLPRRARDRWPLVCSGEEICWVPGFRIGNLYRLTHLTHQAVQLILRQHSTQTENGIL
jgi:tRNA(Ile)-lysidine synthase